MSRFALKKAIQSPSPLFYIMSLLDQLSDEKLWISFYERKADLGFLHETEYEKYFQYIRQKRYVPVVEKWLNGQKPSIPVKKQIAKEASTKKRVVYTLPYDEMMVMRLLTWLMIRKYDCYLSPNLYSFRPDISVKNAFKRLRRLKNLRQMCSYKLDISNYFNSIDVSILLPLLRDLFHDDHRLYDFFEGILSDPRAEENGQIICEQKGVMAGLPTAVFFANVYLTALDRIFDQLPDVKYCRYSDDIIIFAPTKDILESAKSLLHDHLKEFHLEVNPSKVSQTVPGERWTFLGFSYENGEIDVCPMSVRKLKSKMRRKSRSLIRWKHAQGKEDWMAVRAFIKHFNRRLYTSEDPHEINWSRWYFPLINTDKSLKVIDAYMQDCIRYIATETHAKSRYNFRYDQMKSLGYRSLVHEWYKCQNFIKNINEG